MKHTERAGQVSGVVRPSSVVRKGMRRRVERPGVRAGYDEWAETYDATPNPLVALDRRYTVHLLQPRSEERILDAGCGTGANLRVMLEAASVPVGLDLSRGMNGGLRTYRRSRHRWSVGARF